MAAKKKTSIPMGKGKKPLSFTPGGLHRSTNTPMGQKIPAAKMAAAMRGDYGPKAKRQAALAKTLRGMRK